MKKFLFVLAVIVGLTSCNFKTNVRNSAIPTEFSKLEFWNGGGCIGSYENVSMNIEIVTTTKLVGKNISFYKYHITSKSQNIDEVIIDSEALSLKYIEE